jgi:ABC-type multidrug transport system ATPase subunit
MPALSLLKVSKTYRAGVPGCQARVEVLRGVDLDVLQGEVLGVAGGRGAGKTTLLLCAAGLLRLDSGAIRWFGADRLPAAERAAVAFVPELPVYYSYLTVCEALQPQRVAHPLRHSHRRPDVAELADALELREHWPERVASLTRPLVQRVSIAEALLQGARLLFLDEADSALTANLRQRGQELVCALRRWGVTTVVAARNAAALTAVSSRIITLVNGQVSGAGSHQLDSSEREPARVAERS